VLLGAEPKSFALGLEPTPELSAKLPALVEALAAELAAAGLRLEPRGFCNAAE
jgi:hypothetical protein